MGQGFCPTNSWKSFKRRATAWRSRRRPFTNSLILAETSLPRISLLVTSDKHLLDIDEEALLLAFNEADLLPAHPVHPKRLLKALR